MKKKPFNECFNVKGEAFGVTSFIKKLAYVKSEFRPRLYHVVLSWFGSI